jgi:hypothetical protein
MAHETRAAQHFGADRVPGPTFGAPADGQQQLRPGQKVLMSAAGKQSQQFGRGECHDLADRALPAPARRARPSYGPITDDAD